MRLRTSLTFDGALEMLRGNRDEDLQKFIFQEGRKELTENDKTSLGALSFFIPSATFEAWMEVAELTRDALETTIDRLSALSLVDMLTGEERYTLHPLTRAFVRDELLADASVVRETGMRYVRYWVGYAGQYGGPSRKYATYDRLEAEWTNLDAAENLLWETARVKGDKVEDRDAARMLNSLGWALYQFLWFSGRWDDELRMAVHAYEVAYANHDWSAAGWRAYDVAWIHYNRASTDDAALWADYCTEVWLRSGSKEEQATAIRMRGLVAQQRKDYAKAEELLQDSLAIRRDLRLDEHIAITLDDLGRLARERNDHKLAEHYHHTAFELTKKIGYTDEHVECMGNLGELFLDREQYAEARAWFEQELSLAKKVGRQELIAQAQYGLARVGEAENQVDLALPLAQEAFKIYERLQHKDLAEVREFAERLKKVEG